MSTSFPQDVLRRIRALEQGLGQVAAATSAPTTTVVSAGLPINDNDGTTTVAVTHPATMLKLTSTDNNDSSYESFVNVVANHEQSFGKIDYGASSPSTAAEIQCFATESVGTGYVQFANELGAGALYITNGTPSITPVADTAYAWDYANDRLFVYHSGWQPIGWADSYRSDSQASAYTADYTAARVHRLTLTGNVTLTFTNAVSGYACGLTLYLIQDGTGSRTVTWPGSVKWPSGTAPTLSTAASSVDIVVLESTDGGTTWYGNLAGKGYA